MHSTVTWIGTVGRGCDAGSLVVPLSSNSLALSIISGEVRVLSTVASLVVIGLSHKEALDAVLPACSERHVSYSATRVHGHGGLEEG